MTSTDKKQVIQIVACHVFKPALIALDIERRYPHVKVIYLPSTLHSNSNDLKNQFLNKLADAKEKNEKVVFLYGACFPDIDDVLSQSGVVRTPGHFCYEILLGAQRFKAAMDETAGTYFAEKDLILNFDKFCRIPLELDDTEMRKHFFGPYKKFMYIRQPLDYDLMSRASEIAEFLGLALEVQDADYSYLQKLLDELI
ncbi:MAG: DUF1638 domain-containing protein [Chloroflexi bacterium]|jgi:hypothetical protein|nr:DUF1638 domain-containing protein [Chloroflexota bacterium]